MRSPRGAGVGKTVSAETTAVSCPQARPLLPLKGHVICRKIIVSCLYGFWVQEASVTDLEVLFLSLIQCPIDAIFVHAFILTIFSAPSTRY